MMKKVLQLSVHFSPNIGGVETHLDDLVKALVNREWEVFVLAYQPLVVRQEWKLYEREGKLTILRIPWFSGWFYKLVAHPLLEFLYLLPGLFLVTPFVLLIKQPNVIAAHGLIAGFVGVFWGKLFKKKTIVSTHNIYNFPNKGLYKSFAKWIFANADKSMGLSKQAEKEIAALGINNKKVGHFTYWIDLNKFKVQSLSRAQSRDSKFKLKKQLGWGDEFTVLFVGRLVEEKGVNELLESIKGWNSNVILRIIGSGPLEAKVKKTASKYKNLEFMGVIDQDKLPVYYSGSDILIVPSTSEEGFGRVILESLACGTPVIGSKRGGITEAIDKTVGQLIAINPENIKESVEYFYTHKEKLAELAKNCRKFSERRYSEKNVETIIKSYTE